MTRRGSRSWAVLAAAAVSLLSAALTNRFASSPAADVSRGSEEAFASGLEAREVRAGQTPQRWTGERAEIRFFRLPPGPRALEVRLRTHPKPVTVAANGVILGRVPPGDAGRDFALPESRSPNLTVELRVETFEASGGRRLGTQLDRVAVRHAPSGLPPPGLLFLFLAPVLGVVLGALVIGMQAAWALLLAAGVAVFQSLSLLPCGLVRSGYAEQLALLLAVGAGVAAAFASWASRRFEGAATWAFASLLTAFLVQGVAATSPLMVVSDAVFHAHNLNDVSEGDLFPTSVTQHARPFRFPYGVSFYAVLAPLAGRFDFVGLVRAGAGASGVLASAGLFGLLARNGAARAGLAVLLLQVLPSTFRVHSAGNLSNVFGQAMTVLFFAWWTEGAPRWVVGAALLTLGGLSHFGSLIVLLVLCAALAIGRGRALRDDRARLLALAVGLGLMVLYYAHFWRLIVDQLPRLLEGGGHGKGTGGGLGDVFRVQLRRALAEWGAPAMLLGAAGLPGRWREGLDGDLIAFWMAGAVLFLAALVSPLDVRYLYALTLPLSVAAAAGFMRLSQRGAWTRLLCWALLAAQAALGVREIAEAVLVRYRV